MTKERKKETTFCCGVCSKTSGTDHKIYICQTCGSSEDLFVIYKEDDPNTNYMYTPVDWHGG